MSVLNKMHNETLSTIEREPNMFVEAAKDIGADMQEHFHDINEYNHDQLTRRSNRLTKFGQHLINMGRAVAYTGYFWLDDYLMRPLSNAFGNQAASIAVVGTVSMALGGTLAVVRRRQLQDMYQKQGVVIEDESFRPIHAGTASILGAPHTVKQMAIESKSTDQYSLEDTEQLDEADGDQEVEVVSPDGGTRRVRLMTLGAIGASAAVYGYLQGYTAGPVIDAIDQRLPGEGFVLGDVPAVTAFVVPAIYMKSLGSVWYNRRKAKKQKQPDETELLEAA